ncbi:MAG: di-trans,poly-cis-decaprenylcistransferase [Holosporaceae bacterium]|jgi:undecaprenyl diphosphate synthase|nr:di-trans,poly-cis-decaprenylcistransferase [Holosporaceae bacterium]
MDSSPKHVAFILDGNRRWAAAHGMPVLFGHKSGYDVVKNVMVFLPKYCIRYATFYMFSTENWNRSQEEVNYLMDIFRDSFSDADGFLNEHNIRVRVIGDTLRLREDVREKAAYVENRTRNNVGLTAVIAVSYGGRDEITRGVRRVVRDAIDGKISVSDLTEEMFSSYLDTAGIPHPDIIIRTSERRMSNFLVWQSAYSEIFFIDKLWPDFSENDLKSVVDEFLKRERRYGE